MEPTLKKVQEACEMIVVDFFSAAACKGGELLEGWYWWDDEDDNAVGGPFDDQDDAITAAEFGASWAYTNTFSSLKARLQGRAEGPASGV